MISTGGIAIQSQMTGYCGVRRRFATPFIFCQARRFSSSVVESFGSHALFCGFRGGKPDHCSDIPEVSAMSIGN